MRYFSCVPCKLPLLYKTVRIFENHRAAVDEVSWFCTAVPSAKTPAARLRIVGSALLGILAISPVTDYFNPQLRLTSAVVTLCPLGRVTIALL